jgi:hypothetical protein
VETCAGRDYSTHIDERFTVKRSGHQPKENIMNVIKHMEAAFLVALSLAAVSSVAVDRMQPAQATTTQALATTAGVPVVHVTAKRLTPAEKQQMLALERVRSRA